MICQFIERTAEDTEPTSKVLLIDGVFELAGYRGAVANAVFLLQMIDESMLSTKLFAKTLGNMCVEVYRIWVGEVAKCASWSVFFIYQTFLRNAGVLSQMLS